MFESKNKYFGRKKGKSFVRLEQYSKFLKEPNKRLFNKIKTPRILEIGIGSGLNLPFYEKSKINNLYGIDLSSELCDMAKKTASDYEIDVNLLINGPEELELPKDSIDTVVMTYTLCTIPNPMDALKEIKRVMKNDAKMLF